MAVVVQAYRFALDPSPAQERMLWSHAGAARFAWNWGLARCKKRYEAERKWYSAFDLCKLWNAEKKQDPDLAWWSANSKCSASRAHSRKQKGSANRRRSGMLLARVHARIVNIRADALHKSTSELATRYETVVAEDLNVDGMRRNRRLARAVSDQGFGEARRMLSYKITWNGGRLIIADRWFPSSKTCSACGTVKAKLSLKERTYQCGTCGLVLDRDVNAARNLLSLAASGAERVNACGGTARPGHAGRDPVKQEPGTRQLDQTGTAVPQGTAVT